MLPSPGTKGLGLRSQFLTRPLLGSLALRPGDSLTIPRMAWSVGFLRFVSSAEATQATGVLTVPPVGLAPTEHVSLSWTHSFPKTQSRRRWETRHHRTSGCQPLVMMMESTHFRECDCGSLLGRLHRSGVGAIHGQRQMRPPPMVVVEVAGQEAPEVALAEDHHMVQALPPDAADHPLGIRILPGAPRGSQDLVDAQARDAPLKSLAIHGIAVAEQVRGRRIPGKGLEELLCCPLPCRMLSHIELEDSPPLVRQHDQDEEDRVVVAGARDTSRPWISPPESPASAILQECGRTPTADSPPRSPESTPGLPC